MVSFRTEVKENEGIKYDIKTRFKSVIHVNNTRTERIVRNLQDKLKRVQSKNDMHPTVIKILYKKIFKQSMGEKKKKKKLHHIVKLKKRYYPWG